MNINTKCEIILTEAGADWLNAYHIKKQREVTAIFKAFSSEHTIDNIFPTNLQAGTSLELSLCEIMQKFGGYFEEGYLDAPFEKNEIAIYESA